MPPCSLPVPPPDGHRHLVRYHCCVLCMLLPAMPADTQMVSWEGRSKQVYPGNFPDRCHKQKTCFCGLDTLKCGMHQRRPGGTCSKNDHDGSLTTCLMTHTARQLASALSKGGGRRPQPAACTRRTRSSDFTWVYSPFWRAAACLMFEKGGDA